MDERAIYEKLEDVFHDVFEDDAISLTPDMSADDVEGWDSLAHIRLIIATERAFKVKFNAASVGGLKSVGDLVRLIETKLNGG